MKTRKKERSFSSYKDFRYTLLDTQDKVVRVGSRFLYPLEQEVFSTTNVKRKLLPQKLISFHSNSQISIGFLRVLRVMLLFFSMEG